MDFTIRKAAETDVDALVSCHKSFMEHHINVDKRFSLRSGAEDNWKGQIIDSLNDTNTIVLVAETDSIIAGCAYTIIKNGAMDFGPVKIGYLCDVYVEPGYRRKGIARQFLLSSQKWLKEKGITTIEASWSVQCVEAQNTWRALGFIPISANGRLEF